MPVGKFHESFIDGIEAVFRERGLDAVRQFATRSGRRTGYGDLVVPFPTGKLLIEVEMGTRRIENDLRKRIELDFPSSPAWLWIVVPDATTKRRILQRLAGQNIGQNGHKQICVRTYAAALEAAKSWVPELV